MGIGPFRGPFGDTPVDLLKDRLLQFGGIRLGDDLGLHIDILGVHSVHGHGIDRRIDNGIHHDLHVKQEEAHSVQEQVHEQAHLAHTEIPLPPGEEKPHHVHSAAGGSHPQRKSDSAAGDNAAHHAGRHGILHDLRNRNQGQEHGHGGNRDQGLHKELFPQPHICKHEDGDVDDVINNACNIKCLKIQIKISAQHGSDDLADTHDAAGIHSGGHYKKIQSHGIDKGRQNTCRGPFSFV